MENVNEGEHRVDRAGWIAVPWTEYRTIEYMRAQCEQLADQLSVPTVAE